MCNKRLIGHSVVINKILICQNFKFTQLIINNFDEVTPFEISFYTKENPMNIIECFKLDVTLLGNATI